MGIRIRYLTAVCMAAFNLLGCAGAIATDGKLDREEFWKRMEQIVKQREVFVMKYDKKVKDPKTGAVTWVPREEPNMFTNSILTAAARTATNDIIEYWENSGGGHPKELAMILGTGYRESCQTMLDITEPCVCLNKKRVKERYKDDVEACRIAETAHLDYSHPASNGKRFWGRGLSQLTRERNYRNIGGKLGLGQQLVDDPDLALDHSTSVKILVEGMRHAWFTGSGKKLKDYLAEDKDDWLGARDLVNPGSSRAPATAFFAKKFYTAIVIKPIDGSRK